MIKRPFEPKVVDYHALDGCDHCDGMCDHWKTTTQWRTFDGGMVYRCEWICQKCGAQEDRYEDERGFKPKDQIWVGQ